MSWLGRLFGRNALERDLDKELRFHVEQATDDLVRGGMPPVEARRVARLQLGGIEQVKESARDARGTGWVEDFVTDVRHALRAMRRTPGLSTAAILTLAIGIGANTSVWSILDALMRRSLPIERPDELYAVRRVGLTDVDNYRISYPLFQRMRSALPDTTRLAAMSSISRTYMRLTDQPEQVLMQLVSGEFFHLLGVPARLGRTIAPSDVAVDGGAPVAVISDEFWSRRFNRDSSVVGKTVRIGAAAVTIIGVAREEFIGLTVGTPVDLFLPITMQYAVQYRGNMSASNSDTEKSWVPQDGISWLTLLSRQPAKAVAATNARLSAPFHVDLVQQLADRDSSARNYGLKESVALEPIPLGFSTLRQQFGDPLKLLMVSVGLILLITCANLAGLLLARSASRTHEIAVRISLGARGGRLIRQALTESLTMAMIGGVIGLGVAQWTTRILLTLASTGTRPVAIDATLDGRVLLFAFAITLAAGMLFGIAPALRVSRTDLYDSFKTGGRVISGQRSHRLPLGRALVIGQIALSLMLVTSAGVFVRTFQNLLTIDVGYERQQLITARIDVRAAGYSFEQLPALYERLRVALSAVPGARSASLSLLGLAGGGIRTGGFNPPGRNLPQGQASGQENYVSPDYFKTVGIPLTSGREFSSLDLDKGQQVVIISESAAKKFLGTTSVIGTHFGYDNDQPWIIVGVARDARVNSLRDAPPPIVYHALAQGPKEYITSAEVRVSGSPSAAIAGVRSALASVDRSIPVRDIATMETQLERGLVREKLVARLAAGFGVLALLLAAIGLYGVISFSVARRTNEMGVRLALGASPAGVSWVVLRDSLITIAMGLAVGLLLWLPLAGITQRLVYGLSPRDPLVVAIGTVLLLAVGFVGSLLPALKASRIDPIEAIRAE